MYVFTQDRAEAALTICQVMVNACEVLTWCKVEATRTMAERRLVIAHDKLRYYAGLQPLDGSECNP